LVRLWEGNVKFDRGINKKYRRSIDDAFQTILEKGNEHHRRVLNAIIGSKMLVQVEPVSKVVASGRTGLANAIRTNAKMMMDRMDLRDALGQIYITIAEETIDTGGQRGCEGTFVHEGQHAYDFAQTIESLSNADLNPIGVFNPTLYELELEAHRTAGNYLLCVNEQEYIDEGLELMILYRAADGACFLSEDGIKRRLRESYGLAIDGNQGALATEMMGIIV
jgi:hypothetical protein